MRGHRRVLGVEQAQDVALQAVAARVVGSAAAMAAVVVGQDRPGTPGRQAGSPIELSRTSTSVSPASR